MPVKSLEDRLTEPDGLATRLRALRAQAGLSGKDFADLQGWAQSKVSRIENGRQMPSAADIEAWAAACGAEPEVVAELLGKRDDARVWNATFRNRMRRGQAEVQQSYNDLVRNSQRIRHFETVYIPGLLQVPDYARQVLTEMISLHDLEVDDVDAAVEARMLRQQMLYDPEKEFEFLLAEPVLRWLICPPAVMQAQLDRLQTVIGLSRIRLGVLPMGTVLTVTPQNSFQLYEGAETIAVAETFIGEQFHDGDQSAAYNRVLDRMWAEAVTGERARELIVRAARDLPE